VCFIFLTAVDEYDGKVLMEDSNADRMVESFNLYEKLSQSEWFENTPIIVFLNKIDIFKNKIEKIPLEDVPKFDDYQDFIKENGLEDKDNYEKGIAYFKHLFKSKYKGKSNFYAFETCAIDEKLCDNVFNTVRTEVITHFLNRVGLGS